MVRADGLNERQVQRGILKDCAKVFPRVLLIHIPNGAHLAGSDRERAMAMGALKGDGLKVGMVDLLAIWNYGVGFIEVKREKGGTVSPEQEAMHATLRGMGHRVAVVRSSAEALDALASWGAPSIARAA